MLVNKDFLTWPLIGWQLPASQSEARFENMLTNLDFNMVFYLQEGSQNKVYTANMNTVFVISK